MLTVILFDELEGCILRKYQFLFLNLQADKQITLLEWKKGMAKDDILKELECRTVECYEWKLIVYNGDFAVNGGEDSSDFEDILKFYSDGEKSNNVKSFLPVSVWHVGYYKKRVRVYAGSDILQKVDEHRVYGSRYRMIWFDLDDSCEMQREYDLFRLICGMLALALNDIPGNFLECGYLYQLDVLMNRGDFAEYVVRLREQLEQIKEMTDIAYRKLEEDYRKQSRYPEIHLKQSDFTKNRKNLDGDMKWENVSRKDLTNEFSMDDKLKKNRKWIRTRLYFPKGVLKTELGRMQKNVDSEPGVEYLLNDAAKDRLERELQDTLDGMKVQRKKPERQKRLMKKIDAQEKRLMEEKERRQWGGEKYLLYLVLSVVETVLIGPFLYKWIDSHIAISAGYLRLLAMVVLCPAIAGVVYILVAVLFMIADLCIFYCMKQKYGKLLGEEIEKSQKERIQYMEEMVDLIAKYQYAIRLKKEDYNRTQFLKQRKKILGRHDYIRENGEDICRQLEFLLGEDEKIVLSDVPAVSIDFTEEPKEAEYYWVPHRRNKNMADLNRSGYRINVFFDFISGIILKKTPEEFGQRNESDGNGVK